jgi:hypothetical protein
MVRFHIIPPEFGVALNASYRLESEGLKGRLERDGVVGAITPLATIRFHLFSDMLNVIPYTKN